MRMLPILVAVAVVIVLAITFGSSPPKIRC